MESRRVEIEEPFNVSAERMFETLTMPRAIREWWGASRALVDPRLGGAWVATYGEDDGESEYVNSFKLLEYDPPNRIVLGDGVLLSANEEFPFKMHTTIEFDIVKSPEGCSLRMVHSGSPQDEESEMFFESSLLGWRNTFEGLRSYFHSNTYSE